MFKFITHRPLWINILAGIILAVAIFSIFILSLDWLTHHGKSKTVPNVIGKKYEDAKNLLDKMGFEVEVQDSIYIDSLPPLSVLKQVPEGDAVVKVNREVYLTVNRSVPPLVPMTNLVGYSFRSAEMSLKNMGLRVGDTLYKPDFARNAVLEQLYNGNTIEPGTKIPMGSSITLVLGSGVGQSQLPVPNLIGMTYSDAKMVVESSGLNFFSVITDSDVKDTANAYIYWQNPARFGADSTLQRIRVGQTIDIKLSSQKPIRADSTIHLPQ
ncbi:MAG: PASTA domain-containing protein [Bacteroidetes bacterium]|nr:PASTA domain-containing protein [Bacteroidota bacterium]MBS1930421.1 PASTA domain-containing protein [Bacteroidota bacterium]